MALRLRRGTDAERLLITPVEGELIYTTDTKKLYAGDGTTAGGNLVTGSGAGTSQLDDLSDTAVADPQDNDVIVWDAGTSRWASQQFTISDLADVDASGILDGQIISWDADASQFIPTNNVGGGSTQFAGDITGSVFSDDSTLMIDGVNGLITGPINTTAFNLEGDAVITGGIFATTDIQTSSGTISAPVGGFAGDIVGDVVGNVVGDITGSVFADDSTLMIDSVNGLITGAINTDAFNLDGDAVITGGVFATTLGGTLSGDSTGLHTGDVVGNVVGNTTGYHTGDVSGSIFSQDSSLVVDGLTGFVVANVTNDATESSRVQAGSINVGGDTSNLIITTDDSISLILSTTEEAGTINSLKPLRVGGQTASISDGSVSVWNDSVNASAVISYHASNTAGTVTQTIAKARGDKTAPAVVQVADNLAAWQALGYNGSSYRPAGGLAVTAIATPAANYVPSQVGLYTATTDGSSVIQFKVDHTGTSTFSGAAKLAVYADNTARDAAVSSPAAGMMVFNTTSTKFQGYTGSAWVDLN